MSFWFVIVKVTIFFFYIIYEKVIVGFILLPLSPIFFQVFHREISDFSMKQALLYGPFQKQVVSERRNAFS